MNDVQTLDGLFNLLNIKEKGIKVYFEISGLKFWFNKEKGMVRLRAIANALFNAQQSDAKGVASGKYHHLLEKLLDKTVYSPRDGDPIYLSGSGYDEFLELIEKEDEVKALEVFVDMPVSLSLVCLGKPLLSKMLGEKALETSTSQSLEENLETSTEEPQSQATLAKTSKKPARGLVVEG